MPRRKTGVLFVRCTPEEAERIRRKAEGEHRTVNDYILNAIRERIARFGKDAPGFKLPRFPLARGKQVG